jgi:hypothetical protein
MGSVVTPSTGLALGFLFLGGLEGSFFFSSSLGGSLRTESIEARLVASLVVRLLAVLDEVV